MMYSNVQYSINRVQPTFKKLTASDLKSHSLHCTCSKQVACDLRFNTFISAFLIKLDNSLTVCSTEAHLQKLT
jgi:hypothetical protein